MVKNVSIGVRVLTLVKFWKLHVSSMDHRSGDDVDEANSNEYLQKHFACFSSERIYNVGELIDFFFEMIEVSMYTGISSFCWLCLYCLDSAN